MCPNKEYKGISPSLETACAIGYQELLVLVEGYQIQLLMEPVQQKAPELPKLNKE